MCCLYPRGIGINTHTSEVFPSTFCFFFLDKRIFFLYIYPWQVKCSCKIANCLEKSWLVHGFSWRFCKTIFIQISAEMRRLDRVAGQCRPCRVCRPGQRDTGHGQSQVLVPVPHIVTCQHCSDIIYYHNIVWRLIPTLLHTSSNALQHDPILYNVMTLKLLYFQSTLWSKHD